MSGVSGVSPNASVVAMMKVLEQGQEQSLDLAKKLIKMSAGGHMSSELAEGKGRLIDLLA